MQHSNTAGCILLKFYIKPQHTANVYNLLYVVSYRNSTSNHNLSKRNGAPFTVTTVHDAEVVVRGTKFNLKAYDDSSDVETVLVEGAVDFRAADHVVALHPGQKVSYNPTDNDLTLQTVNVEAELAARLRTFRHVDLAQIAGVIKDFYGIGVAFRSEALKNIQFTGTLDFNMPIDHILEVLTLSTNTRFNRNGEKITIHK